MWQGRELTATNKLIVDTHVEGSVGGGSKSLAHFAHNVLRTAVVIAHSILDLYQAEVLVGACPHLSSVAGTQRAAHAIEPADISPGWRARTCILTC